MDGGQNPRDLGMGLMSQGDKDKEEEGAKCDLGLLWLQQLEGERADLLRRRALEKGQNGRETGGQKFGFGHGQTDIPV